MKNVQSMATLCFTSIPDTGLRIVLYRFSIRFSHTACSVGKMFAASSDEDAVISRKIIKGHDSLRTESVEDIYEIDNCVQWAKNNKFSKVALQFPDSMLADARRVALEIQKHFSNTFILADTTYSSCCVDEVAAEHVDSEAIIHFGNACLSPTSRLPVFYVFPKYAFDLQRAAVEIKTLLRENGNPKRIIVLFDICYAHSMMSLKTSLDEHCDEVLMSKLSIHSNAVISSLDPNLVEKDAPSEVGSKLRAGGRVMDLASGRPFADYVVLYVGGEGPTRTTLMLALHGCRFFTYDPVLGKGHDEGCSNRMMLRRHYLVEKARDAKTVGILVGTLGIVLYRDMIEHLRTIATRAGKKVYTLLVGKPNPAKLANFPEIDVFVYVACPETSLIDSKEYYRPIVTPYEFQLAHNQNTEWSGQIITDFDKVLSGYDATTTSHDHEGTNVSLITGGIQRVSVSDSPIVDDDGMAIAERNSNLSVAQVHRNGAGEFLTGRTWQGLNPLVGQSPATFLTEGQRGIASRYEEENQTT